MAKLNPIVFIPPTVIVLAILVILVYRYSENIQQAWDRIRYRNQGDQQYEIIQDDVVFDEGEEYEYEYEEGEQEDILQDPEADDQANVEPQGTTTSARLRMHHEMVQQMRARAGYAPEPFPGDEEVNEGDEEEEGEDNGGVGSSNGTTSATRIKKIGKKRAEKLQRKEQMRAYREYMDMQREERRQQDELFKMQEAIQQEERKKKRSAQIESDRKRKEQLKTKEAKENDSRQKRIQSERLKEEKARRELRAYIQRVNSFRLCTLATRLGRTEEQLRRDLEAVAQDEDLRSSNQTTDNDTTTPRISLGSNSSTPTHSNSGVDTGSRRPQLLVLYDSASDVYAVLDVVKLKAFADAVKSKGRIDKSELSIVSENILSG